MEDTLPPPLIVGGVDVSACACTVHCFYRCISLTQCQQCQIKTYLLGLTDQCARDSKLFGSVAKVEFIRSPVNVTCYDLQSKRKSVSYLCHIHMKTTFSFSFFCIYCINSWCKEIQNGTKGRWGNYFYCYFSLRYFMFRNLGVLLKRNPNKILKGTLRKIYD